MHWTYVPIELATKNELEQGDILLPTPALRSILATVHPHFASDKYHAFMVTTQSCDLVVRGKKGPKARYISLAAVRPLRYVIPRLLEGTCGAVELGTAKVLPVSRRGDARELLERILNQNEQSLGLFYLHPDADIKLVEECVAFLRVTVALRADHYDALIAARSGRLDPEFRGKLGWLIGNLYSRAAAPDWSDHAGGSEMQERLIEDLLREDGSRRLWWVADDLVAASRNPSVRLEGDDVHAHVQQLKVYRPRDLADQVIDEVQKQITRIAMNPPAIAARRQEIKTAVAQPSVQAPVSDEILDGVEVVCAKMVQAITEKIAGRLKNNATISSLKR